ncbi:MAG: hypothetical protein ABI867_17845 [Kofleriaceae bacterium]
MSLRVVLVFVLLGSGAAVASPKAPAAMTCAAQAQPRAGETPQAPPPDTNLFVQLYVAVGKELSQLHRRDPDAASELMTRYRYINVLDAVRIGSKRQDAARRLHELHRLIELHR